VDGAHVESEGVATKLFSVKFDDEIRRDPLDRGSNNAGWLSGFTFRLCSAVSENK